jgi:protein-S-isoprenylcysteine O-methyltransferase Ste14
MEKDRIQRLFGVGPAGVMISLVLLGLAVWVDRIIGRPVLPVPAALMKAVGMMLMVLGLGIHFWSFWTLRHWWAFDRLCNQGPFRYFRHPMYAAWITFVASGLAFYMNSWVYFLWVLALHPIWHRLVTGEEAAMAHMFGGTYRDYAAQTGRFFPRIRRGR